jgi:hypothetical protein
MILSETVRSALVLAACSRPVDGQLHTGLVFDSLARVDQIGDWQRLWLHTGQPDQLGLADAIDSDAGDGPTGSSWEGVPLSGPMGESMRLLADLADAYSMQPVPPGALALALVAVPSSGAARILTSSSGVTMAELVGAIQSSLLGGELDGLDRLLASGATRPGAAAAEPALVAAQRLAGPREADDLDLVLALMRDQAVSQVLTRAGIALPRLGEVARVARPLGSRPASEVTEQAKADADTDSPPDPQITMSAIGSPSLALARTLRVFGTSGQELAAAIGAAGTAPKQSDSVYLSSVAEVVVLLAVYAAVVDHAFGSGELWQLALLAFAATGPPSTSTLSGLVVAGAYWILAGPLVGSVKLAETVISYWHSRTSRRDILRRTGIQLSERTHNRYTLRRRAVGATFLNRRNAYFLALRLRRLDSAARRAASRAAPPPEATR